MAWEWLTGTKSIFQNTLAYRSCKLESCGLLGDLSPRNGYAIGGGGTAIDTRIKPRYTEWESTIH